MNISWFNILVLKLFSNKNGLMAKLCNALIILRSVFMHVHCIRLCMLETYIYNFDRADWEEAKKGIMLELLRIKFQAGSEMNKFLKNTSGKSLAEAGKSRSFAIGMPLNSKNIFDTSKWPKNCNMLGKCLMEVRTKLNA